MEMSSQLQIPLNSEISVVRLATEVEQVSDLFTDMAILVENQGECIDNIETNIVCVNNSVDKAAEDLRKANKYKNSNRRCCWRICIVGIVSIVSIVGIFFIVNANKES